MKKELMVMSVLTVMTMLISGCWMNEKTADKNAPEGTTESSESYVNSNGTKVTKKVSNDVSVKDNGARKAVATTKVTEDPKGLLNKKTVSQTKDVDADEDY